jgi:hypothetical protein
MPLSHIIGTCYDGYKKVRHGRDFIYLSTTMRVDLFHLRPLVRPVFTATGRRPLQFLSTRSFSNVKQTQSRVLESLSHKPFRSPSLLFKLKSSRSFMTDSTAISQPTKAESWKRFGITAVRDPDPFPPARSTLLTAFVSGLAHAGSRRWHRRSCRSVFEQGYQRRPFGCREVLS